MNTLIIYASKYGCTADCAVYLKTKTLGSATLIDINKSDEEISLNDYDTIIIGASVYIGKISKKLRTFCENNLEVLTKKKVGIFLCCALTEQIDEVLKANLPAAVPANAVTVKSFGSEARLEKMSFLDKLIIKAVSRGDYSKFKVLNDEMDIFLREMQG